MARGTAASIKQHPIGLLRKMPFEAVMRMALVGKYERMSAQRAYELGMVSQLVEPDKLGFAVRKSLGVKTFREIVERQIPLKASVRSQGPNGATAFAIGELREQFSIQHGDLFDCWNCGTA